MKKIILVLAICLISGLSGCSSDDESTNNNNTYFRININGTPYVENNFPLYSSGWSEQDNCQSNGDLFLQYLAVIENSTFYLEPYLSHFENTSEFDNATLNNSANARLLDRNSANSGIFTGEQDTDICNFKYDLSLIYEDKASDKYLKFKVGAQKQHNITKVTYLYEDQSNKTYLVEGNFLGTFTKNGTDIPFSGDYKSRIDVLK